MRRPPRQTRTSLELVLATTLALVAGVHLGKLAYSPPAGARISVPAPEESSPTKLQSRHPSPL